MLAGIWCSELEVCYGERLQNRRHINSPFNIDTYNYDHCLTDNTIIVASSMGIAITCANKEESDTASQNKNGIWCSDISTTASTQNMYIGPIDGTLYYCNNNIATPLSAPTPDITLPPRTYQECKNKNTCKGKIKFNVLVSILSFILNE